MVFVKALKSVAMAHALLPLVGCAIGLGQIFNAFIRGISYSPDLEDVLFSHAMLGFALVESFMVIALAIVGVIYTF
jgi:F-type H+-transporting ATPase subunit c